MPRGAPPPMTSNVGSRVRGSIAIRSMAPGAARMPWRTTPPSSPGPAEPAPTSRNSRLPTTISAFVPMSTSSDTRSRACMPETRTPASASPPT